LVADLLAEFDRCTHPVPHPVVPAPTMAQVNDAWVTLCTAVTALRRPGSDGCE